MTGDDVIFGFFLHEAVQSEKPAFGVIGVMRVMRVVRPGRACEGSRSGHGER